MEFPIIVFSHLRWNFVFQRPQQLLTRLAKQRRVIFVEETLTSAAGAERNVHEPYPNVLVWQPETSRPAEAPFADEQLPRLRKQLAELLKSERIERAIAWFYTPMAIPLLDVVPARAVVYDCMDELSAFLNPPPQLLDREAELLRRADVVFTGGRSIYRHKRDRHRNAMCFPSSVDSQHFAKSKDLNDHDAQRHIDRPRMGFFGVVDERMDLALLDSMASAHPQWQIVIVGPVVKIDPNSLPRRPNIHYFGQQDYKDLPQFLSGWDVCLLPFALNKATRFISPTKTLEYMAAEKPIVSTPITDVAEPYGDLVYIGRTADEFINACERALASTPQERELRFQGMRRVLSSTSWDATARSMWSAVEQCLNAQSEPVADTSRSSMPSSSPVVVIGAGPTGLSATYHLGPDALLLEQNDQVGGWCRSFVDRGFTFDMAGHIMFSNDSYVHEMYRMLLGENVHWQDREAFIYSKGVYTRYPFQGCLYGLPPDVITECIMGAVEARFGSAEQRTELHDVVSSSALQYNGMSNGSTNGFNGHANGTPNGTRKSCASRRLQDCCADGVAESDAPLNHGQGNGVASTSATGPVSNEPANFEEFIYKVWGKGIAKHFAIPYNQKLWAVPLKEMETSWLGGRVPMPDIEEMIRYALTPAAKPMGPNARFGYPLRGGFQALMNGFLPYLEDRLKMNARVSNVSASDHTITLSSGETIGYEQLISTMPLPTLIKCMGNEVPAKVRQAARELRYVSVRCVNIGIGRPNITEKHWVYYPEDTVFHRIFFQGNASPHCNPPGGFGLTCEITYSPSKPLPCDGQALIDLCIDDCRRVGLISQDDPIWTSNQVDLPFAYVVYDHGRGKRVELIRQWLARHDIFVAGRYGQWEYFNSDHAFITGKRAAEEVKKHRRAANTTRSRLASDVTGALSQ